MPTAFGPQIVKVNLRKVFNQKSPPQKKLLKQTSGNCVENNNNNTDLRTFPPIISEGPQEPSQAPKSPAKLQRAQTSPKWWSPVPKGRAQSRRAEPNPIREASSPNWSQCGHHQVQRKIPQKVGNQAISQSLKLHLENNLGSLVA